MKKTNRIISILLIIILLNSIGFTVVNASTFVYMRNYTISGWDWFLETETEGKKPDATMYLDSTEKHSGNYSLKMVYNSSPLAYKQLRGEITAKNIKPNAKYRLGFYAKAEKATDIRIAIEYIGQWMELTKKYGSTFDWKQYEIEFTQTLDKETTKFVIASYDLCDAFWIDDLYLYEVVDGEYVGKNLISNPGFENGGSAIVIVKEGEEKKESFEDITASDAVIVKEASGIKIDGDLSDWNLYESIDITTYVELVVGSTQTISSNIRYAYDNENLYVAVEADDEEHRYEPNVDYWKGDCVQLVVDNNNANGYGEAIGAYFDDILNEMVFISDNGAVKIDTTKDDTIQGQGSRVGDITYYEIEIPWSFLGMECPEKVKFDLIVNDNDGGKRKGYLEIAPGIGKTKTNEEYPYLYLGKGDTLAKVSVGRSEINVGEINSYSVDYSNCTDEDKTIIIKGTNFEKEVTVPKMKKYYIVSDLPIQNSIGNVYETVSIIQGGIENNYEMSYSVIPDDKTAESFVNDLKDWHKELSALRDECNAKGISTEYENVDIQTVELFIGNLKKDIEYKQFYRVLNYYEVLSRIYDECKNALKGYLKGDKTPVSVPRYITGNTYLRDGRYYGMVEEDGHIKEKNVIFYGYNSFETPTERATYFKNLGHNHMQTDLYPSVFYSYKSGEFVPKPEEERYGTRTDDYEYGKLLKRLDDAQKNNIAVNLHIHIMGFISAPIIEDYPDYKESSAWYHHFMPFTPTHPMVQKQAEAAYAEVTKIIDRYDCVKGICLLNEPTLQLYDKKYYTQGWVEYLKRTYNNDLDKMNVVYDSNYLSFEDVNMPKDVSLTPLYHDYRMYCEEIFTEFVSNLVTEFRKYSDLPISVKIMQQTRTYQGDNYTKRFNTVYEKFHQYMDINGCDAFYKYDDSSLTLQAKMEWYDYLTSIKKVPVANTEEHWASDARTDKKNDYSKFSVNAIEASGWQGMMHGAAIQDLWIFSGNDRSRGISGMSANEMEGYYVSDVMLIPEAMRKAGRLALDAMRLSDEIYAIQEAERDVGILWSNTTWSYNTKFLNALYKTYTGSVYNGQKVNFVTESTLDQMKDCKIMIIPGCTNVTYEVVKALKEYVDSGARLVIIGENAINYDDHNQPFDKDEIDYIKSKALIVPCDLSTSTSIFEAPENLNDILFGEYKKLGLMDVVVIDKSTGEIAKNVEWIKTNYNGKKLISIFNYDYKYEPDIEIYIDGEKIDRISDIKNLETYEGEFKLESYKPYLIVEDISGFTDLSNVPWAKESIYNLFDKKIVDGIGNNKFSPHTSVTREQIVKIVVSVIGGKTDNLETAFSDVDKSAWYAPYLVYAEKMGITSGISENEFGVGLPVTRQDLAVLTYNTAKKAGMIQKTDLLEPEFADEEKIADYAKEAVASLQAAGVINGDENGLFNATNYCTRAEAAVIVDRLFFKK